MIISISGRALSTRCAATVTTLAVGLICALPSGTSAQETITYYHQDGIGSVRLTTHASGNPLDFYDYLPFGEPWQHPTVPDRRGFTGAEKDSETTFNYLGARYLFNGTGRFTAVDPLLDTKAALIDPRRWNRYTYALNNPLQFTDPDGRDPRIVGAAVGAIVYAGWNAYVNVQRGQPWYQNIGIEASKGLLVGGTFGLAGPALSGTTLAEVGTLAAPAIAGPLGTIARAELDRAMNAGGQTIELVTKLTQSPAAGRALSAAGGEGAQALAAGSRAAGNLYMARIPQHVIGLLHRAGLVEIRTVVMNGVRGVEYRFRAEAMQYLSSYFQEIQ